jgi:hypothetical protein
MDLITILFFAQNAIGITKAKNNKGASVMVYDSEESTLKHIKTVELFINQIIGFLSLRSDQHDRTKLVAPEKNIFDEYTPKLRGITYGSEKYKGFLKEMEVALDHHYQYNRHHPEHFSNNGTCNPISCMNLVDIIEMLCDWKAATLRHADGNIMESIEINQSRFGYCDTIKQILINTIKMFEE